MYLEKLAKFTVVDWPAQWVTEFVRQRGLTLPDGRHLYAYRCSTEELDEARDVFRKALPALLGRNSLNPAGALFCLYAAEWWRRNHSDGPWKWAGILDDLGIAGIGMQHELYPMIVRGLKFWKVDLLRSSANDRMFLLTLGCEGGLPLRMIRNGGGSLARYFRALLDEFATFRSSGVSVTRLAQRVDHHLPAGLRRDVVHELSGRLIEKVWELKEFVGDVKDPIAYLDRSDPDWRSRFPLSIDDSVASSLLSGLVMDAVQIERVPRGRVRIVRRLVKEGDEFRLIGEVICPTTISEEDLARSLGVAPGELPSFGRLVLESKNGKRVSVAAVFAVPDVGGRRFRLDSHGTPTLPEGSVREGWSLRYESDRCSVGHVEAVGGQALEDIPWAFAIEDEVSARFVGQGSVRTRYGPLLVVMPDGCEVDGDVCVGTVSDGLRVIRVDRAVAIRGEDAVFTISASQTHDRMHTFRFAGQRLGACREEVFVGMPQALSSSDPEQLRWRHVAGDHVSLAKRSGGRWVRSTAPVHGLVRVRVLDENAAIVFEKRIRVVPEDFQLELAPHRTPGKGAIVLSSRHEFHAEVVAPPSVWTTSDRDGHELRVLCEANGDYPLDLPLRLRIGESEPLELTCPYPSRVVRVARTDGRIARHEEAIPFGELAQWQVTACLPDVNTALILEGTLEARSLAMTAHYELAHPLRVDPSGRQTLDLIEIESRARRLFALCEDHVARIRTRIAATGVPPMSFEISRFDSEFVFDEGVVRIEGDEDSADGVTVLALRLWDPSAPEVELPVAGGGWSFEPCQAAPGPWIVFGRRDGARVVRPALHFVEGELPSDLSPLAQAICVRERRECADAIDAVLAQIAVKPLDHGPDWAIVAETVRRLDELPPSVFLVMIRMSKSPFAAVTALIQADESSRMVILDALEELPFLWSTVPLEMWREQALRWADGLRETMSDPEIANTVVRGQFDSLIELVEWAPRHRLLELPLKIGRAAAVPETTPELLQCIQKYGLADLEPDRQALIARHEGIQWPALRAVQSACGRGAEPADVIARHRQFAGFLQPALNAPVAAARHAVHGEPVELDLLLDLRRAREMDPEWFDRAYQVVYARLAMQAMQAGGVR
jgi:hypothetical protein